MPKEWGTAEYGIYPANIAAQCSSCWADSHFNCCSRQRSRAYRCLSGSVNTWCTMCASRSFLDGRSESAEGCCSCLGWTICRDAVHKKSDGIFCILLSRFARRRFDRCSLILFAGAPVPARRRGPRRAESFEACPRGVCFFSQLRIKDLRRRQSIPNASHTSSKEKGPSALSWKIQNRASLNSCRLLGLFASKFR